MDVPSLDSCIHGYRSLVQHLWLYSEQYLSAVKTTGVLLFIYALIQYGPVLIHLSSLISPIFTVQLFIVTCGLLVIQWRSFSRDIKGTLLRSSKLASAGGKKLWYECLSMGSGNQNSDRVRNRKVVRMIVMFTMMHASMQPTFPFLALMAFVVYLTSADFLKFRTEQLFTFFSSIPGIRDFIPLDEMENFVRPPPEEESAAPSDASPQAVSTVCTTIKSLMSRYLPLAGTTLKLIVSFLWFVYFLSSSVMFMTCVYTYVSVTQKTLEYHLITMMLANEIDGGVLARFEGLEQYYIIGGMAVIEALITLVFMVWVLVSGRPILMLVALYTNVYCGGYDTFNFIITPIAHERAFLANFERVSGSDLQSEEDTCPICMARMGIARKTRCGHMFHGHCLRKLVSYGKVHCPLCRSQLS